MQVVAVGEFGLDYDRSPPGLSPRLLPRLPGLTASSDDRSLNLLADRHASAQAAVLREGGAAERL